MSKSYNKNITSTNDNQLLNESKIIKTDVGTINGHDKCPKCGSTDVSLNASKGNLRCNFCRHEFEPNKATELNIDLSKLSGQVIGSGATDIISGNDIITLKCSSCGSEVVIDTSHATQARCHWCRSTLSVNQQIPNGSIPDLVLPFSLTKEEAQLEINKFVSKRKFFAHPKFKSEFTTNNIIGVYLPYMLVGANTHASFSGEGEIRKRVYFVEKGNVKKEYYDADLYHVEREFDLTINDLSVESSSDKLNISLSNTNNVINAIMPFDTENCVKFNSNYLKGYNSEKRDVNIDQLRDKVEIQTKDIARFAANDTLKQYNRGVRWFSQDLDIKGQQWKSAYLPVWLYSFQEVKNGKKLLHYVAVNARTKETMGSIPVYMTKLLLFSVLVEILGILAMFLSDGEGYWLFLLSGFIYFIVIYLRYRNKNARHTYEKDTETKMENLRKVDKFIRTEEGLTNPSIIGANNTLVSGLYFKNNFNKKEENNDVS